MAGDLDPNEVAATLRLSVSLLVRRLRQIPDGDLTMSETSALVRLSRGGPTTTSVLAKLEQISPQSMGATLAALEERGLIERHSDPGDGRRALVSLSEVGHDRLRDHGDSRVEHLAAGLSTHFTPAELKRLMAAVPLIERLAAHI